MTVGIDVCRGQPRPRARRVPVTPEDPINGYDYADAFEIRVGHADSRSAEQMVRYAIEQAPRPVRWTVWLVHRHVLRSRLGPRSSPDHVLGWRILTSQPDVIHLEAESTLGRGVIVARRVDPTCVRVTTYLFFLRSRRPRIVWKIVGPLHRRIAPYLLERASAATGVAVV